MEVSVGVSGKYVGDIFQTWMEFVQGTVFALFKKCMEMNCNVTIIDNALIGAIRLKAQASDRLRMHFDLRNTEEDHSQRMLNVMEPGTRHRIHRHLKSSETVVLLRGRMDEVFYDDQGNETERIHLGGDSGVYGVNIPQGQWHSIEVYEPTVIFEAKDGKWEEMKDDECFVK